MNELTKIQRELEWLERNASEEISRLRNNLERTGHHQNACGDDIIIERLSVLRQQLKDTIHEIENPGSMFSALKHALQDNPTEVRAYNIGIYQSIVLDTKMKSYEGKTIVEAARKMYADAMLRARNLDNNK